MNCIQLKSLEASIIWLEEVLNCDRPIDRTFPMCSFFPAHYGSLLHEHFSCGCQSEDFFLNQIFEILPGPRTLNNLFPLSQCEEHKIFYLLEKTSDWLLQSLPREHKLSIDYWSLTEMPEDPMEESESETETEESLEEIISTLETIPITEEAQS